MTNPRPSPLDQPSFTESIYAFILAHKVKEEKAKAGKWLSDMDQDLF